MIQRECPHCQRRMRIPDAYAGKRIKCVACRNEFAVIATPSAVPSPQPAMTAATGSTAVAPIAAWLQQHWLSAVAAFLAATAVALSICAICREPAVARWSGQQPLRSPPPPTAATASPAAVREYYAEYYKACKGAAEDLLDGLPDPPGWAASRLAQGLPVGTAERKVIQVWARRLDAMTRDEYARRCIAMANGIRADVIQQEQMGQLLLPWWLYETAYNVAVSKEVQVEAFMANESLLSLHEARHSHTVTFGRHSLETRESLWGSGEYCVTHDRLKRWPKSLAGQ